MKFKRILKEMEDDIFKPASSEEGYDRQVAYNKNVMDEVNKMVGKVEEGDYFIEPSTWDKSNVFLHCIIIVNPIRIVAQHITKHENYNETEKWLKKGSTNIYDWAEFKHMLDRYGVLYFKREDKNKMIAKMREYFPDVDLNQYEGINEI